MHQQHSLMTITTVPHLRQCMFLLLLFYTFTELEIQLNMQWYCNLNANVQLKLLYLHDTVSLGVQLWSTLGNYLLSLLSQVNINSRKEVLSAHSEWSDHVRVEQSASSVMEMKVLKNKNGEICSEMGLAHITCRVITCLVYRSFVFTRANQWMGGQHAQKKIVWEQPAHKPSFWRVILKDTFFHVIWIAQVDCLH